MPDQYPSFPKTCSNGQTSLASHESRGNPAFVGAQEASPMNRKSRQMEQADEVETKCPPKRKG